MPRRLCSTVVSAAFVAILLFGLYSSRGSIQLDFHNPLASSSPASSLNSLIKPTAQYFLDYPLNGPKHGDQFGEMGQRVQILTDWISLAEANGAKAPVTEESIERVLTSMFPFLRNPSKPRDKTPFASLRKSYIPGSRGIVIPTGTGTFRYACHLVLTIREVHHSNLPIQIVYSGDADLPDKMRKTMAALVKDIEFLDILSVFDDETLQLRNGSWAIKPFAVLGSKFEQVLLVDADSVFMQPPESVYDQAGYRDTGILLYHDRLLWQHRFQDRHDWWKKQMEHKAPSAALLKSLVWMEDYAEEGDSGLVIIDKGRLPVLMGLLHISWQNSFAVREEITYKITYGDKESWWFGFELSNVPYTFEKHYGSIVGWMQIDEADGREKVCSFTIAHTDDADRLLWYNGSLLKNKAVDGGSFEVPTHWMMEATWEKGGSKPEMSCMKGGAARLLTPEETKVIEESIEVAKKVDIDQALV